VVNEKLPNPWTDYTVSTAIILPALFWISVIGKRLIGFNLLYWTVYLLNKLGRLGSFEGIERMAIDDPVILIIGAACTACLGVVAFFRIRDYRLLRERGITIEADVKRVKWSGDWATLSFQYEQNNRRFATSETVPGETGRPVKQSGRITLLIDPKSPRRCIVQHPGLPMPR
jgi:hypothetical protein